MQVIQSVKFKYETSDDVKSLLTTFRDMINFCIEKALQHKVTSFMKLRALIYDEFKERFKGYNTQYCYSAVRIACNILKSWRRRGKEPRAKKLFSRFVSTLTKFEDEKLRISFKPRKFITLKLICGEYQKKFIEAWRKGECRIGEIILNENFVIIPFIKEVDLTNPNESIAIDINESNVTAVDSKGNSFVIDLSEVKRIHYCYFQKRRNIQKG